MSDAAYKAYLQAINEAQTDPEYLALEQRFRELEPQFRTALHTLPEDCRSAVIEYIGVCGELQNRLLELACFPARNEKL